MADPTPTDAPDWQPTLRGERLLLRPLRSDDLDALHAAANDPKLWEQHTATNRHERAEFERFFAGALASGGALVAIEQATGRVVGTSRYYLWRPTERRVVVGFTFLVRALWGTGANRELKRLMLEHAFRWADVVEFHVSPGNLRSQQALARLGAQPIGEAQALVDGAPSRRLLFALRPGELRA